MCHYTSVSWKGAPRWVRMYMMVQVATLVLSAMFWCTVFLRAFLANEPVPQVVSQTIASLFAPLVDHLLPFLKQLSEDCVEMFQMSITFYREQQEREILRQAHRHCEVILSDETSVKDPELRFVCRTLLLKLLPNITETIQADSEPLMESEL